MENMLPGVQFEQALDPVSIEIHKAPGLRETYVLKVDMPGVYTGIASHLA